MKTSISHFIPFVAILLLVLISSHAESQQRWSVFLKGNYGYHFSSEKEEGETGRFGYGVGFRYLLSKSDKPIQISTGASFDRIGVSRTFTWDDPSPQQEQLYGPFPVEYQMWRDVYYFSIPFHLDAHLKGNWFTGIGASFDYPFGAGYYNKRSSADVTKVEINKDSFDQTKWYLFNTSIGASMRIGKMIPMNEDHHLIIESMFKVYTLLAARSNDYFPHEDYERPYTLGLNIGLRF